MNGWTDGNKDRGVQNIKPPVPYSMGQHCSRGLRTAVYTYKCKKQLTSSFITRMLYKAAYKLDIALTTITD